MNERGRLLVGLLWIGVAGLMAMGLGTTVPTTLGGVARLFVVVLALFLAVVYLFDPWDIHERLLLSVDDEE